MYQLRRKGRYDVKGKTVLALKASVVTPWLKVCIGTTALFIPLYDDMIYLLTAIGLSPGGRSRVHIYTQTIRRTTQNKQYIEQHNSFGRVRAVPRLG